MFINDFNLPQLYLLNLCYRSFYKIVVSVSSFYLCNCLNPWKKFRLHCLTVKKQSILSDELQEVFTVGFNFHFLRNSLTLSAYCFENTREYFITPFLELNLICFEYLTRVWCIGSFQQISYYQKIIFLLKLSHANPLLFQSFCQIKKYVELENDVNSP